MLVKHRISSKESFKKCLLLFNSETITIPSSFQNTKENKPHAREDGKKSKRQEEDGGREGGRGQKNCVAMHNQMVHEPYVEASR
jgi:hypothetical protein